MFATKGRLVATTCIVWFLEVGLGMYGTLQINEVEAHGGSHVKITEETTSKSTSTRFRYVNKPCPYCGKLRLYTKYERVIRRTLLISAYEWNHLFFNWDWVGSGIDYRTDIKPISTSSMCYNHQCPQYGGG